MLGVACALLMELVVKYCVRASVVAVFLSLLFTAASLHAIPTLRISADLGATWVTVRDSDGDGNATFSGAVGAEGNMWSVSVAAAETKPAVGSAQDPVMNLSSLGVSSAAAGTLLIEFSDKSFTGPLLGNAFTTSLSSENSAGGNTSIRTYWDSANILFSRPSVNRLGSITQTGLDDSSVVSSGALPGDGLYSLTMRITIFHDAAGSSSFSSHLVDPYVVNNAEVPEGGTTLVLLGLALFALGVLHRWAVRRRTA